MGLEVDKKSVNEEKNKSSDQKSSSDSNNELLPVSLLCGFLGAGKTTLMKHILETKHAEEGFRCAVIVNDMAALNIDKNLIDQSALVQSDEVIAMQNGCFCCTLQNDLVDQIISLAEKKIFNYMLIEASGVSEPAQIAPLFELCDDEHDHEEEHKDGPELGEVARLDTCVTVIDAAEFYSNLDSMKTYEEGDTFGTVTELMMEQVEYSNVVVLNKLDLVDDEQQSSIMDRISIINPNAKVLKTCQSKINVMEILNTNLFKREKLEEESVMIGALRTASKEKYEPLPEPECCIKSIEEGKKKCCKSKQAKKGQMVDSGKSQILLGVLENNNNTTAAPKQTRQLTRHEKRFGITSFIYKSRRPFHPGLLYELFLEPFFIMRYEEEGGPELRSLMGKLKKQAATKKQNRDKLMGELLRSKGFVWLAASNSTMGGFQQAGNIVRVEAEGKWMCEQREMWEGTETEAIIRKDFCDENGKEYPYLDRRQELVFIGIGLKHENIQNLLDQCLLNDEEMAKGPEKWEEEMQDDDRFQFLESEEEDDEEEDEEDEGEEKEEEGNKDAEDTEDKTEKDNTEKENDVKNDDQAPPKKRRKAS